MEPRYQAEQQSIIYPLKNSPLSTPGLTPCLELSSPFWISAAFWFSPKVYIGSIPKECMEWYIFSDFLCQDCRENIPVTLTFEQLRDVFLDHTWRSVLLILQYLYIRNLSIKFSIGITLLLENKGKMNYFFTKLMDLIDLQVRCIVYSTCTARLIGRPSFWAYLWHSPNPMMHAHLLKDATPAFTSTFLIREKSKSTPHFSFLLRQGLTI